MKKLLILLIAFVAPNLHSLDTRLQTLQASAVVSPTIAARNGLVWIPSQSSSTGGSWQPSSTFSSNSATISVDTQASMAVSDSSSSPTLSPHSDNLNMIRNLMKHPTSAKHLAFLKYLERGLSRPHNQQPSFDTHAKISSLSDTDSIKAFLTTCAKVPSDVYRNITEFLPNYPMMGTRWYNPPYRIHQNFRPSITFNADGSLLASASGDNTIQLWKTDDGSNTKTLHITEDVPSDTENLTIPLAFSPSNIELASGSSNGDVTFWNIYNDTRYIFQSSYSHTNWHTSPVTALRFSPSTENELFICGFQDGNMKIKDKTRWFQHNRDASLDQFMQANSKHRHQKEINTVVFYPHGFLFASCDNDGIKVWNESVMSLRGNLGGEHSHTSPITTIAASPYRNELASGASDGSLKLWNVDEVSWIRDFSDKHRHTASIRAISFSRDGTILVSGAVDGTIKVWRVSSGLWIADLENHDPIESVAFSPTEDTIVCATATGEIKVWKNIHFIDKTVFTVLCSINRAQDPRAAILSQLHENGKKAVAVAQKIDDWIKRDREKAYIESIYEEANSKLTNKNQQLDNTAASQEGNNKKN